MKKTISCPQCEGTMHQHTHSSGNISGLAGALVVFALGILLTASGVLAIVGIPLILFSLFMGGKRTKGWKCEECGYFFERV